MEGEPNLNTQIIAIANQKGGVGKTTTTANLGIGLARTGKRVLLIDADPQASLTISLGYANPDDFPVTINSMIQSEKRKTRGYNTFESFAAMIYLVAGKLELPVSDPF